MANHQSTYEAEFFLPSDFLSDELFSDYNEETESSSVGTITNNLMRQSFFENDKSSVMATSPQSTLSGVGSWSFNSNGGSPDGSSLVSSPPSTPFKKSRDEALDLLYKASNRVDMLRFASNQEVIQQQLQAARFYQLRRQQLLKQQQQLYLAAVERKRRINAINATVNNAVKSATPLGHSWPSLQKQPEGGDRTAVLLNYGARRQSNGTGVFLPRRTGIPFEPRKKPIAGPTVFLPARVVQALNLNVDDLNFHRGLCPYNNDDYMFSDRTRRNFSGMIATTESKLPQDWTYINCSEYL